MTDNNKDKIQSVLSELYNNYRIVYWYDEGGSMFDLANQLDIEGVKTLFLTNNAFTVKYQILMGEQPERGFLIYSVDARPADEDNWLLDLEVTGVRFSADMGSLYASECHIPFEYKTRIVDEHLDFFRTAENREKLSGRVVAGMSVESILRQMLAITTKSEPLYGPITLALAKEDMDGKHSLLDKLTKYNLADMYWQDIEQQLGYSGQRTVKDMMVVLFQDDLKHYIGTPKLKNEARIFLRDWRDSRSDGELYKKWAEQLEEECGIKEQIQGLPLDTLLPIETFPCVDKVIAQYLQMEVLNSTMSVERMESIVDEREHKLFFSEAGHTIQALLAARRMTEAVNQMMPSLTITSGYDGMSLYAKELYKIDLYYRHYFREAKESKSTNLLAKVSEMMQRVYTNSYLLPLANKWQPMVDELQCWGMSRIISQQKFYDWYIKPLVLKGTKVFVIISDALRYETMVELEQRIAGIARMETSLKDPMLSTMPSYTQLGMAALLPHKELSYEQKADVVYADGISTAGTENRKKILCNTVPNSLAIRAEDFLAITNARNYFKDYDLIYIYSNVIDKRGDNKETEGDVFKATEEEFEHIIKMVELIRNGNGSNIFITSDHGYIYQNEPLDESDFVSFQVMGDTFADTRRFIIGNNLQPGAAVRTWKSEEVGLKAGREIQICKGLNRLRKQGSGSRYVHGGSMLQEIAVPVLHINIKKASGLDSVDVDILNKRACITSGSQIINFYQTSVASDKVKPLSLRMGFYTADGEAISDSVTLMFDSQSADSAMREQKHQFAFRESISHLNGQEVMLRMERQVAGTEQYVLYKQFPYKVNILFMTEF